jgi:5-methylthioadenosine/S-adenosylhomocysteine deaminase
MGNPRWARALGMDNITGSITPGKKADLVLIKNDQSPAMFPLLNPYGHVVFQAGRGDVHTVMVDGKVVKHNHRLIGDELNRARQAIEKSVEYIQGQLGEKAWNEAMNPENAVVESIENPYTYTDPERARSAQRAVAAQEQENG